MSMANAGSFIVFYSQQSGTVGVLAIFRKSKDLAISLQFHATSHQ